MLKSCSALPIQTLSIRLDISPEAFVILMAQCNTGPTAVFENVQERLKTDLIS
jgi:hypothetical protein